MFCTDCGNTRFIEFESDLTCNYCGLVVLSHCNFLSDYGQYSFFDMEGEHESKTKHKEADIFDNLEFPLGLNRSIIDVAKGILQECKFKGEGRRLAFVAASLYYASTKSIADISTVMGIPPKCVHRASTEIMESCVKYASIVRARSMVECHMLNRLLQKQFYLSPADEGLIRCTVLKMKDKTQGADVLKPFKEDKVLATMIFMACEKIGIKDGTIKNVALACGSAVSTIKNIRMSLKDLIV